MTDRYRVIQSDRDWTSESDAIGHLLLELHAEDGVRAMAYRASLSRREWVVVVEDLGKLTAHRHTFGGVLGHTERELAEVPRCICGELPGEGAEYEPSDGISYEYGSIRGTHHLEGEWTGCEHCIAAARREMEEA